MSNSSFLASDVERHYQRELVKKDELIAELREERDALASMVDKLEREIRVMEARQEA